MPCAAAVLATWSGPAHADEPAWLEWQAPPECPTGEHISKTLEGWLGRPFGADEAQVTATVSGSAAGWNVNVLVVQRDLRGERTMTTRTCIEAADFVALSIALAVDPGLEAAVPAPAPTNEEAPPKESPSEPSADSRRIDGQSSSESPSIESAAVPVARSPERADPERAASTSVSWHVQAGATMDAFTLPSAQLGGSAELGVTLDRLSIGGGVTWLPPVTESVPSAKSDVAFSRLAGRLRVGYLSTLGVFELSPYVEGQAGEVFAEAVDASYLSWELWLTLGAGGQVKWPAGSPLQLYGAAEALFPLNRPTFALSGGTEVHTIPRVSLAADLGLCINF